MPQKSQHHKSAKRSVRFRANLLYYSCKVVGLLPWWFLYYVVAEAIYFILYYVVRYRIKVTRTNLQNSFPEKGKKELRKIERGFYRHLSQVFIDTIDLPGISKRALLKRMPLEDEAQFREKTRGQDWIAATSHYGSWEYFMFFAINIEPERRLLGVYKPLHDEAFDLFYEKVRSKFGMIPTPMRMVIRDIRRNKEKGLNLAIGIIGDQTPLPGEFDRWFDFLHQPTPFYGGIEKIAMKFGMPVYFMEIEKVRRAHYIIRAVPIWDGREEVGKWEITQRYADKLEEQIRRQPEYWMWSHRRWKRKPQPGELNGDEWISRLSKDNAES